MKKNNLDPEKIKFSKVKSRNLNLGKEISKSKSSKFMKERFKKSKSKKKI